MEILIPVLVVAFVLFILSVRVVQEYDRGVIFFLGKYTGVRGPGLILLIPIFERMIKVTLRTITMEIPSQKIITKDNVSIDIAAVAYYNIVDPKNAVLAIENIYQAVNQICQKLVQRKTQLLSSLLNSCLRSRKQYICLRQIRQRSRYSTSSIKELV